MSPRTEPARRWITLLGLIVSALFVYVAVRHLDTSAVVQVWKSSKLWPWTPLAIAFYVAGHFVRGQRLRFLVRRDASLPLLTASNVVIVGYAANNVLPARLGELVRAGMLAERTGVPLTQALTVTLIERLLDGVAILFLLVLSAVRAETAGWIRHLAEVGTLVFGVALAGLSLAVLLPGALLTLGARALNPLGARARDRGLGVLSGIVGAAARLRSPRDAAVIAALSVIVWLLESMMFVSILPAIGRPLDPASGVIAMSVTNLGILVPSTPGFVGPFHFFCSQALQARGASEAVSMAYAVLVHLSFYVPATLWGAGAMLWYGVQVGASAALARAAKSSPATKQIEGVTVHVIARAAAPPPSEGASAFDVALTEALLPPSASAEVLREVSSFASEQIAALPSRLRALYHAGMTVFRFWVRVRYLRGFCELPLEKRRRAVASWAFGPIFPLRQLFRPARSTALLAYYEHESVRQAMGERAPLRVIRKKAASE